MEIKAVAKSVRISPRKVRFVVDAIRHVSIDEAIRILTVTQKRAALPVLKVLKSAIANAVNNQQLAVNDLAIESIQVSEGQSFKRFRPSTRGRVHPYKKRASHILVILKQKGGKAKAE